MPFTSWPLQFGLDLARGVREIRLNLLGKCIPPTLYHYTDLQGVLGIGNSCAIHATSVEDSKDQTEIAYGIGMTHEEIQRRVKESSLTRFARMLLESLPDALTARRPWTFVACFCPRRGSAFHCIEYGGYCLQFDTLSSPEPQLRAQGLYADVQYQHVIYASSDQHRAIRQAIASIVAAAVKNSHGDLKDPWMESITNAHARTAAQCLMDIIVSLKSIAFADDEEWRILCHPQSSLASSAPDLDDARFNSLIKARDDKKRYVALSACPQRKIITAFPKAIIPFSKIHVAQGLHRRDEERLAIMQMLEANGRGDIPVIPFS